MKVRVDSDWLPVSEKEVYWVFCGNCDEEIKSFAWEYCPYCGEKIEHTKESIWILGGEEEG